MQASNYILIGMIIVVLICGCSEQSVVDYKITVNQQTIVVKNGFINKEPAWHPDGTKIVYTCITDAAHAISSSVNPALQYGQSIKLVTVDGKQEQTLITESAGVCSPRYSPNARFLAYCSRKEGSTDLYVFHFADHTSRKLTSAEGEELCPHWAPDGQIIAFIHKSRMCLIVTASSIITHVDDISVPVHSLCWTADGREIIFSAGNSGENALYRYIVDEKRTVPFGAGLTYGTNPDYAIMRQLAPLSERQVAYQRDMMIYVYSYSVDTVSKVAVSAEVPAWSPDGTHLAYSTQGSIAVAPVWNIVHE